ncbi:FeoB family transport protein [Natronomonas pharaonis DSM 2160]|uniref:FeoB family transport protein n=1 Tax=Natronomonas pharaonis (strain ATCC 35678 / DSM 2160 / CIP 103997 / JCM 8858 / NBRC 14720 / NCIMB 2260 / Gabara) TaxID=348780 RepID=A0A1U7EXG1_NATPD|nr:nucleoside recognition domain-containing protein [Natronomonas pharaonis]CAI49862.1 FeoB family transport protein [Natronomonas pharaonis DSM 2160]
MSETRDPTSERRTERETVVVAGKESVGKSELVASLTGDRPTSGNFRGTTVRSERYTTDDYEFVDTPGIVLDTDTEATRDALSCVSDDETVLLVVPATDIDSDLEDLLPLVDGHLGAIVVTFWDKVEEADDTRRALETLSADIGVPIVPVDARNVSRPMADGGVESETLPEHGQPDEFARIMRAIDQPGIFPEETTRDIGRRIEPPKTVFEWPYVGPAVSIALLLLPAALAVWFANTLAGELDPLVGAAFEPLVMWAGTLPEPLATMLATQYGFLSMGPFLFVWAGPTMLIFAVVLGVYKNTGLVTRMTVSLHPTMRRVGLTGRDLVRVVMGFGCNVPAVINTRSCSDCTRCTTISAISFGSACSYQFPATLAVFAAVGMWWLVGPYLLALAATTLIYVAAVAPPEARQSQTVIDRRTFLSRPDARAVAREAWSALREFFFKALPVFVVITFAAALLDESGGIDALGGVLGPVMSAFNLPAEAALTVVLASVRKDGIALLTEGGTAATLSPLEVLVAVYLAGVLLPCLVTVFTVAREVSAAWAAKMVARQAAAAVVFALIIAWGGRVLLG